MIPPPMGVPPQKANEICLDSRNVLCPIPGCKNYGGKGFRRAGIGKHLMGQHPKDLERSSVNFSLVDSFLRSLGRKVCVICNRITIRCTVDGFCDKCDKKRPMAGRIVRDLTRNQREKSTAEMISIQKTNFRLRRAVPRKLYTLWSDLLTDIALGMADATKESEARRALKRYLMVKAVLIQPVRGGGARPNRNVNLTEKLMFSFGKEERTKFGKQQLK